MATRWRSRGVAAIGCVGALAGASTAASAGGGSKERPDPVTCSTNTDRHRLDIRLRERRVVTRPRDLVPPRFLDEIDLPRRIVSTTPAVVRIQRRIDEITVMDETPRRRIAVGSVEIIGTGPDDPRAAEVRSCGAPPTVAGTDSVRVRLGRRNESADMILDLRYGSLVPGFTDEADGGSEIELDARLGEGTGFVKMTRGADDVAVARPPAGTAGPVTANLDAREPAPDADLVFGRRAGVLIDGIGGDDRLSSDGGVSDLELEAVPVLAGGQGADVLTGGRGTDALFPGPGPDVVDAGAGADGVLAEGRAADRIDCGPGFDFVLFVRDVHRIRSCEGRLSVRDLIEGATPREVAERPGLLRKLRRSAR